MKARSAAEASPRPHEAGEAVDEAACRHEVGVVELGVLAVEGDEQRVGVVSALLDQLGLHAVERGEVAVLFGGGVHGVDAPVLVAALVLEVDDVAVVLGPEKQPDAAHPVVRDGLEVSAVRRRPDRPHPDVQDAVLGGQKGQALAVGGEAGAHAGRVAEEDLARDQGHSRSLGHAYLPLSFELSERV